MLLIRRPDHGTVWPAKFIGRAQFIGCVGLQDPEMGQRLTQAFSADWERVRSFRLDEARDDSCWFAGDGWWFSTAAPDDAFGDESAGMRTYCRWGR
jgi:protein-L-isoaspartate(D-aspartate) O-methyltransferase